LKVFLGAAPGVGKTYEMLTEGVARRRDGADVVIGLVETHGRPELDRMARTLPAVPRRAGPGPAFPLTELDLDGVLARRPALVLIDALAHANLGEARHARRYQDVEELLAAGIDVHATLNIQHLESLNDVVAALTHVRVADTLPDRILESAEIEVVDIPPDELIERLHAGKVHVPHEATRALAHAFSKSTLSALRELALRRAAQTVDTQMLDYVRAHALAGNWAGGERIVVAVSEQPGCDGLVRATKRLADALHASWTAVHIETPRARTFGDAERARIAAVLNLATQLGGAVASVPADSVLPGLKAFAADARATQLVVGKSARSRWFELRHGSVVDRLVRDTPGVAVHVLPMIGPIQPGAPRDRTAVSPGTAGRHGILWATMMVIAVTALAKAIYTVLGIGNTALLYLLPVMVAASLHGRRAGLYSGLLSSMAYNFFFLPPTGTLSVSNPENVVTILVLLSVAVATSQLAARVRAQADMAASSARQNAALAGFLHRLNASGNDEEVMQAICGEIGCLFDVRAALLLPSPDGPRLRAAVPPEDELDYIEATAAQWVLDKGQPAGRGSDTLTASDWLFYPLKAGRGVLGAVGIARDDGRTPVRSDQIALLTGLLDQAALVLERMLLESEMRDVAQLKERDRLRAALLSSVSHDLRTPITAILAAASELRIVTDRDTAIGTIEDEARRLNRFVANLLDMARVEAGALVVTAEPTDLTDAIGSAVHDTRRALTGRPVVLAVPADLPLVRLDPQLFHHVLINLLDNAGRYGDPGTAVTIQAERLPDGLVLSIMDEGPGLPPGREVEAFETFARLRGSDRAQGGTGLGLAIVKGFVDAMGMTVAASTRIDPAGARFSVAMPDTLLVRGGEA
jgi:two-component system sensor histidine kinase KdpD